MNLDVNPYNVIGFKLTNGLEVIAKLNEADSTEKEFDLEDAFFMSAQQQQDGSLNIDYVPLTYLGTQTGKSHPGFDVKLPKTSVLFTFKIHNGIVDRYLSYVSPIVLAS